MFNLEIRDPESVKGEEGVELLGEILEAIDKIAGSEDNAKAREGGVIHFASVILKNNPADVLDLLRLWTGVDLSEKGTVTILAVLVKALNNETLRELFGLQH